MADSASESDSSSTQDGTMMPPSPVTREQLHKRIESLQQQNRVLKVELDTYKLRVKTLQEETRSLRQTSVNIQAKAEQEEEFISNTLMKQIQTLKKEKETLAHTFEQEEECLTNDLSRKLNKLRAEKCKLEQTLEQEQECLVNKLMRKIEKLEAETCAKQNNLEQLRREKVELENTLEQEQEALVNRLWKRMDKLEAEKRNLQNKVSNSLSLNVLGGPVTSTTSSAPLVTEIQFGNNNRIRRRSSGSHAQQGLTNSNKDNSESVIMSLESDKNATAGRSTASANDMDSDIISMTGNVQHLRNEVDRLKAQLAIAQNHHTEKMCHFAMEERQIRDENLRLQRRLQLEMERREQLCRHLSESESSLEMEDERHFHESLVGVAAVPSGLAQNSASSGSLAPVRPRPGSSPGPFMPSPVSGSRPLSPGLHLGNRCEREIMSPPSPVNRCHMCNGHGWIQPLLVSTTNSSGPFSQVVSSSSPPIRHSGSRERFARPFAPPSAGDRSQDREPRTPGDSTMSSPSPSPAPFEVMSPSAPSPSPMDTSKN